MTDINSIIEMIQKNLSGWDLEDEYSAGYIKHGYDIIEQLRKMSDWQPIETAPKDVRILVVCMDAHRNVKHKEGLIQADQFDHDLGCFGKFNRYSFPPTHWMPLPKLPSKAL